MKEMARMSIKEAGRLCVMRKLEEKTIGIREASEELGVSERQTKRIRKRYLKMGEKGLISQKRGKESNRKTSKNLRSKILNLMKTVYLGFGPTLAKEKLEEREQIKISGETLRKWLIEEGLWKSKKKKAGKVYQRRERRSRFGAMLQGDGAPHDWFEGRGPKCSFLQFVDDATSKTTAARFVEAEGTEGYLELLREHLRKYGRPLALYVDKHTTFRVNREETKKGTCITHFGRVVKELEIELICAHSPQAKGRVERKHGVFQDRLVKEMRLRGICNIEEGNKFLPEFLEEMNVRFGIEPANSEDAHRVLRRGTNLDKIFARREIRKLSKNLTFQYRGILYLIQTKTPNRLKHGTVEVVYREGRAIEVEDEGKTLSYKKWEEKAYEQPKILDGKQIELMEEDKTRGRRKPGKHHPWR